MGILLPGWVGNFLHYPDRAGHVEKLGRSKAPEQHFYIEVTERGAPGPVEFYLAPPVEHLPTQAPNLPGEVTSVWVEWGSSGGGVRWDGSAWKRFGGDA